MSRLILRLLLVLSLVAVPASAAGTAPLQTSLDADGHVLNLYSGIHADLFPGSTDASSVLALDVVGADGAVERHLVPGSENAAAESAARMVYEPANGAAYLVWESLYSGLHPVLLLTSFESGGFTRPIEITSGLFDRKGSPDLVVTRDSSRDDHGTPHVRTVMHLTWWQEAAEISRKLYAPIVLEDGEYLGWTPIYDLSALAAEAAGPIAASPLADALRIRSGQDHRTVTMGFLDSESGRLVTLRARVHPRELSDLADKARGYIIDIGRRAKSRVEVAEGAVDAVLADGGSFHPAFVEYVAVGLHEHVMSSPLPYADDPALADSARGYIIDIGARFRSNGLSAADGSIFLAVGADLGDPEIRNLIEVRRAGAWEVPAGIGERPSLYVSPSGDDVLVAWSEGGAVSYLETTAAGWSAIKTIRAREGLDAAAILAMLADRVGAR